MYANKRLELVLRYRYMRLLSALCIGITISANTWCDCTNSCINSVVATEQALVSYSFSSTSVLLSSSSQDMVSVPDMDANGIARRPRRIAGGDKDCFEEGEDGEKLPDVTNKEQNKTPVGDVPISFMILQCTLYVCCFLYDNKGIKFSKWRFAGH